MKRQKLRIIKYLPFDKKEAIDRLFTDLEQKQSILRKEDYQIVLENIYIEAIKWYFLDTVKEKYGHSFEQTTTVRDENKARLAKKKKGPSKTPKRGKGVRVLPNPIEPKDRSIFGAALPDFHPDRKSFSDKQAFITYLPFGGGKRK